VKLVSPTATLFQLWLLLSTTAVTGSYSWYFIFSSVCGFSHGLESFVLPVIAFGLVCFSLVSLRAENG
jgi:hypothetical protein